MPKKTVALDAKDQLNLLISLIGLVNRVEEISIEDAARQLQTTPEVILEAARTVNLAGDYTIDSASYPFAFSYPALEDGMLRWWRDSHHYNGTVRISVRQAAAIAAGLSFLKSLPEFADAGEIDELVELLKHGHSDLDAPSVKFEYGSVSADIEILRKAILGNARITCNYTNQRGEQSDRELDPIRLEAQSSVWYLRAWCPKNKDVRAFRIDRMRNVQLTEQSRSDEALEIANHQDDLDERIYVPGETDIDVIVEVDPEAYELVAEFSDARIHKPNADGKRTVTIKVGYLANLGHLIAKYGGAARVIEPPEAREIVKNYALRALGVTAPDQLAESAE